MSDDFEKEVKDTLYRLIKGQFILALMIGILGLCWAFSKLWPLVFR